MRGPCACPGWSATRFLDGPQASRVLTRTSTRPPPVSTSAPCPYRTLSRKRFSHYQIWLEIFIIGGAHDKSMCESPPGSPACYLHLLPSSAPGSGGRQRRPAAAAGTCPYSGFVGRIGYPKKFVKVHYGGTVRRDGLYICMGFCYNNRAVMELASVSAKVPSPKEEGYYGEHRNPCAR